LYLFLRILDFGKRKTLYLLISLISSTLSGFLLVWPTLILKILPDLLSTTGEIINQSVQLDIMPRQLSQYGFGNFLIELNPSSLIKRAPLIIIFCFFTEGLLRLSSKFFSSYFSLSVVNKIRIYAHQKIINLSFAKIKKDKSGEFSSRIVNDLSVVQALLSDIIILGIRDSISIFTLVFWLLLIDWKATAISLIVIPLLFGFIAKFLKKIHNLSKQEQAVISEMSSYLSDISQGADLIKLFNLQYKFQERFIKKSREYLKHWRNHLLIDGSIAPILSLIVSFSICLVLSYGSNKIISKELSIGDLVSYLAAILLLYTPIKRVSSLNSKINQLTGASERVFQIIEQKAEIPQINLNKELKLGNFIKPELEFKEVCFSYPIGERLEQKSKPIFKNFNLKIEEGEHLAIIGKSGSGKSTLIKLIARFYDPDSGLLSFANQNILDLDLQKLRASVSFVPQEPFLFSGTIKENLLYAKPGATNQEIKQALDLARVDFLNRLPQGVDSKIRERADDLSGGQKQRLSIARAFLRNAPFLILDEPTSSLDKHSENLIKASLEELVKNKTVLIISHRESIIQNCSRIVNL